MSMFCSNEIRCFLLAAAILGCVSSGLRADDFVSALPGIWPGWRGPSRDGRVSADDASWPDSIDENHLRLAWRVELGPGYSGPIVAPDRVFTTETADEREEVVRAFDRRTGRELWQARWEGAMEVPFFADRNGDWIRCTPAYDGQTLFVGGMRDRLVALDASSGAIRWSVDFPAETSSPLPDFGFVSSPLLDGDALYVQAGAAFYRLNKADGTTAWKTLDDGGGKYKCAFSSPILADLNGSKQVIVQTRNELCGVDPETGKPLWKQFIESFRGMNILTPTIYKGAILTSNYRGKTYLFRPVADAAGGYALPMEWKHKAQAYMSSPVVIGDHAYLHLQNRRVCCIDLRTGEETWRTSESFGDYWSMAAQGEKILALDQTGELLLLRANPGRMEIIERRQLAKQETWAHVAVAGPQVAVRELRAISLYDWR